MMKKVHIIFLMVAALLPFTTRATEQGENSDPILLDSIATVVEGTDTAIGVADTVAVNATDTVSTADISAQLEGRLYCPINPQLKGRLYCPIGPEPVPFEGRIISLDVSAFGHHNGPDFHFLKNYTNPTAKPYTFMQDQTWVGIPVFLAGLIAKSEKTAFRQNYNNSLPNVRLIQYNFHTEIDNYTQFSGIALTAGLKMAGVEGRSSWPRLFASSVASYAVMAGFVNSIKYTTKELRPDETTKNSWPSGHTATAFVGATILHKEYGLTRSPWYSVAGYTLATATGVMRVLNNRHWVSDVLSGAGIGILSTELAYGICDLLFKGKGLLMNDISYYPDLRKNPSFFSVSMGIGLGNKNMEFPPFDLGRPSEEKKPLDLKFRSATVMGIEGAWFFSPHVGIGGRLRVKSTPINGWSKFSDAEEQYLTWLTNDPNLIKALHGPVKLSIESDHITEFAADAGVYFSLPISSRFALGTKLLGGRSVMDDIEVDGTFAANRVKQSGKDFIITDQIILFRWTYVNVHATNSTKFGTGLSLTYAHKNSFSWRVFCDYDYTVKTYTASYAPIAYLEEFSPEIYNRMKTDTWDPSSTWKTSTLKHLHQWVLGGALCVSF